MLALLKNLPKTVWLVVGAIALFILCISFANWKTDLVSSEIAKAKNEIAETKAKLNTAYEIIDKMHDEHEAALETANAALKERLEIYETARERICEAEKKIGGNTDFCNQLVPDDIIMLWRAQDAARLSGRNIQSAD